MLLWRDGTPARCYCPPMTIHHFTTSDGVRLAYRILGEQNDRDLILIHGLFSSGEMNWVKFGHAQKLADAGFRVILPDLRAHGLSEAPHGAEHYPDDILARDMEELITHLGLTDYDLGGFSLGARTTVRLLMRGAKPQHVILGGAGLEGLAGWSKRKDFFLDVIEHFDSIKHGDPRFMTASFMKTMKVDREAAKHLLGTFTDTNPEDLQAIVQPVLVVCGTEDFDNGSAEKLVAALPNAVYAPIPGTHMSSVAEGAMGDAMVRFLAD